MSKRQMLAVGLNPLIVLIGTVWLFSVDSAPNVDYSSKEAVVTLLVMSVLGFLLGGVSGWLLREPGADMASLIPKILFELGRQQEPRKT